MTPAMSLASGVTVPSVADDVRRVDHELATGSQQHRDLPEDRAELAQVDGVVAVIGRVAGERVLRVIRGRHVWRRGQYEVDGLIHEPRQVPGISQDQPPSSARPMSSDLEVFRDELDADRPPSHPLSHRHGGAVAGERVEDEVSRLAGVPDDGLRKGLGEVDVIRRALGSLGYEVCGTQDDRRSH